MPNNKPNKHNKRKINMSIIKKILSFENVKNILHRNINVSFRRNIKNRSLFDMKDPNEVKKVNSFFDNLKKEIDTKKKLAEDFKNKVDAEKHQSENKNIIDKFKDDINEKRKMFNHIKNESNSIKSQKDEKSIKETKRKQSNWIIETFGGFSIIIICMIIFYGVQIAFVTAIIVTIFWLLFYFIHKLFFKKKLTSNKLNFFYKLNIFNF